MSLPTTSHCFAADRLEAGPAGWPHIVAKRLEREREAEQHRQEGQQPEDAKEQRVPDPREGGKVRRRRREAIKT